MTHRNKHNEGIDTMSLFYWSCAIIIWAALGFAAFTGV